MIKSYDIAGYPFYTKNKVPGICMYSSGESVTYFYPEKDEYYTSTIKLSKLPGKSKEVYSEIIFHAKVISTEQSIVIFNGEQRRRDILNSVLRVINYRDSEEYGTEVTLLTSRHDQAVLKMLIKDVKFIYPTIQKQKNSKKNEILVNQNVIAIKDCQFGMFNKGDKFLVEKISEHEMMKSLNLLYLINDKNEVITYSKFFKKTK